MPTSNLIAERHVASGELFFSTTDRRGIITSVNSVFERIAAYPSEALVGQPHNIVRHPDMPAGVFAVVWDLLNAGRPVVAHIANRAGDGATYWVLATITPISDGFLSVRTAPADEALRARISRLYQDTLATERGAEAQGLNSRQVAAVGKAYFVERVQSLGYADVDDFMRNLLPSEVTQLARPNRPASALIPEPGRLQSLLEANLTTEREVRRLLDRLDDYVDLVHALDDAHGTAAILDGAVAGAASASHAVSATAPVLGKAGQAAVAIAQEMVSAMQRLTLSLEICRDLALDLRMRIALAKLHADTVSFFVEEVARSEADAGTEQQITWLSEALEDTLGQIDMTLIATNAGLNGIAEDVDALDEHFLEFQRILHTWRHLVVRFNLSEQISEKLVPIDAQLNKGMSGMAQLRDLASLSRKVAHPIDTSPIHDAFRRFTEIRMA
jgi:PAS domain S-box-containing protein